MSRRNLHRTSRQNGLIINKIIKKWYKMDDLQLASATSLSDITVTTLYDKKTRTSFCWQYFGNLVVINEIHKNKTIHSDQVYCLPCLMKVKEQTSGAVTFGSIKIKSYNKTCSTSNLTRHLREDHNLIENVEDKIRKEPQKRESKQKERDVKPGKIAKQTETVNNSKITNENLNKDIILWVCGCLIPFDSVSTEAMANFLIKYKTIVSAEDLPSPEKLSTSVLNTVYSEIKVGIKETICADAPTHVGLSFDIWTDQQRQWNYVTFTLHYLTNDFQNKSLTLATHQIVNKHSNEELIWHSNSIVSDFGLNNAKIYSVSNTNWVSFDSAEIEQQECFGHGFHKLLTIDGIQQDVVFNALVQKCKRIVKVIAKNVPLLEIDSKNTQILNSMDDVYKSLEDDEKDPLVDKNEGGNIASCSIGQNDGNEITPTRWHVLLQMLEWLSHAKTKERLNIIVNKNNLDVNINTTEWNLIRHLKLFLKKFEEAVEAIRIHGTCNLNVAMLFRSEVIEVLMSVKENNCVYELARLMIYNIDKRLPVSRMMVASALLDSRFTNLKQIDLYLDGHGLDRTQFLSDYIKEISNIHGTVKTELNESVLLTKLSLKHQGQVRVQDDPIEQECCRYLALASPFHPKNENLLSFWNRNKNNYPWVSSLAKALLCIPATSASSERMFSNSGLDYTTKRSRLDIRLRNKVIFIHDNCKANLVQRNVDY